MSSSFSRRRLLELGLAAAAFTPAIARANVAPRSLTLQNLHTGEALSAVYWENGDYVPDALSAVNKVLRDFRTGETHAIDPRLLDLLGALHEKVEALAPFQIISGYRSPQTNARLHQASSKVAVKSLHMQGMAVDIRVPGVELACLHDAALQLRGGGVGYYPADDFVHVDVGAVRTWRA